MKSVKSVYSVKCAVWTQEIGSVGTWRANTIWVGCGIGQGGEPGGWADYRIGKMDTSGIFGLCHIIPSIQNRDVDLIPKTKTPQVAGLPELLLMR